MHDGNYSAFKNTEAHDAILAVSAPRGHFENTAFPDANRVLKIDAVLFNMESRLFSSHSKSKDDCSTFCGHNYWRGWDCEGPLRGAAG